MAKKKRPPEEAEHIDESWLVPYADVLTLLLALFIVLFASSKVDQEKFDQLAASFNNILGGGGGIMQTGTVISPGQTSGGAGSGGTSQIQETEQLESVKARIDKYINSKNLQNLLYTRINEDGLIIEIKDRVLYNPGSAALLPQGKELAGILADVLNETNQNIIISGHTDNIPINTVEFPSNWELSSKRAINFMKDILEENRNLNPQRFSAIGYAEYRPITTNITPEGRSQNRRVEVLISRNYPVKKNK